MVHTEEARTAIHILQSIQLPTGKEEALRRAIVSLDQDLEDTSTQLAKALSMVQAQAPWVIPGAYACAGLTPKEESVLACLYANKGRPVTKRALHEFVYPDPTEQAGIKIIDIFVCKIRNKLAPHEQALNSQGHPTVIQTLWGRGYRLAPVGEAYVKQSRGKLDVVISGVGTDGSTGEVHIHQEKQRCR